MAYIVFMLFNLNKFGLSTIILNCFIHNTPTSRAPHTDGAQVKWIDTEHAFHILHGNRKRMLLLSLSLCTVQIWPHHARTPSLPPHTQPTYLVLESLMIFISSCLCEADSLCWWSQANVCIVNPSVCFFFVAHKIFLHFERKASHMHAVDGFDGKEWD